MNRTAPGFLTLAIALLLAPLAFADGGVKIGAPAPEFELPDQEGQLHSLEDYRDQWVVLYFYPKDETPGCTTEACEFRDNIFAFRKLNTQILGVSQDEDDGLDGCQAANVHHRSAG
jgi:peroxiredoxin Q/BCP